MESVPYMRSQCLNTSGSDHESPDYFGFNSHIDQAVDVFMDRLGGRLGELEVELHYAWKAVDLLSQEYVRMWEKLERLEILLYEQQNVIAQLLSVMQANGAHLQTQHNNDDPNFDYFNTNLDLDVDMEAEDDRLQDSEDFLDDPSEAFARQTFQEWLSQNSFSLRRHSELLEKLETYDTSQPNDSPDYSEIMLDESQYRSESPPPVSRHTSSRWLTRRQTLRRWQEIDDPNESIDKVLKNVSIGNNVGINDTESTKDLETSEIFSVTDYLDYRANTSACVTDNDIEELDRLTYNLKVSPKSQVMTTSSTSSISNNENAFNTTEEWLREKLNAYNVLLIHEKESNIEKTGIKSLNENITTPSTESNVTNDNNRNIDHVIKHKEMKPLTPNSVTVSMSSNAESNQIEDDTNAGIQLISDLVSNEIQFNKFNNTSSDKMLGQISKDEEFKSNITDLQEKALTKAQNNIEFISAKADSETEYYSNGFVAKPIIYDKSCDISYTNSHDKYSSNKTLNDAEIEISKAIKLINGIEEYSKTDFSQINKNFSNQSEERKLLENEVTFKEIEDQQIIHSFDNNNKASVMSETYMDLKENEKQSPKSDQTFDIQSNKTEQKPKVDDIEVSQTTQQYDSERSLLLLQRTPSGKRKLPSLPSLPSSPKDKIKTNAQNNYSRVDQQSIQKIPERQLTDSAPVQLPSVIDTTAHSNSHRRGDSFDENKGLFSTFASSVYQGYQSVLSMPTLFKRDSQEKFNESLLTSDQTRKGTITGIFSGFGWKSSAAVPLRSQSVQQTDSTTPKQNHHQLSLPELNSEQENKIMPIEQIVKSIEQETHVIQADFPSVNSTERKRQLPYVKKQQSIQQFVGQNESKPQLQSQLNGSTNANTAVDTINYSSPPSVQFPTEKRPQNQPHSQMNQNFLFPTPGEVKRSLRASVSREDSLSVNPKGELEKSVSEESAFFSCVSASSRQSSILQSEYGSMESSDSIALSLGNREYHENIEKKSAKVRGDNDSAFCSTNGDNKSAFIEEIDQQSLTSSTSPLPTAQTNQLNANNRYNNIDSPSVKSPLEKRDSVCSTSSSGFQNRFASIMRQKLEERAHHTNAFPLNSSASIDMSTGDSSIDSSDVQLDDTQRGAPKKGRTKWMVAVVRSFMFISLHLMHS
jgi:hypothetical protein